jgi:rhomboid protease GluP
MKVALRFPARTGLATMMVDVPMTATLDGAVVYQGSFVAGFAVMLDLEPGDHTLATRVGFRKREYTFRVPPVSVGPESTSDGAPALLITLDYDSVWGNFRKELSITETRAEHAALLATTTARVDHPDADFAATPDHPVRVTWVLLAMLLVFMVLEYVLPVAPRDGISPGIQTLVGFGGLGKTAWQDGEAFRFLTCTLLHADLFHLLMNSIALVMAGPVVERKLGSMWMLVIYGASSLVGSLFSVLFNRGNIISIGASGAIMGLFAAGVVVAALYPPSERSMLRYRLVRVLVPSLLPMLSAGGHAIDFGAHLGGALGGAGVGGLIWLAIRQRPADTLRAFAQSWVGRALALGYVVALLYAVAAVPRRSYPEARRENEELALLIPNEELVSPGEPAEAQWAKWSPRFPDDPRVLLHNTRSALNRGDRAGFEEGLARAKGAIDRFARRFPPETQQGLRDEWTELDRDRDRLRLIPNLELPSGDAATVKAGWEQKLDEFARRFPDDPRVHNRLAYRYLNQGEAQRALDAIARTRTTEAPVQRYFSPPLDFSALFAIEALALHDVGRLQESAALVAKVCAGAHGETARNILVSQGTCK